MNTTQVENIESSQLDIMIKRHRFSAVPSPPGEKAQENLAILSTHAEKNIKQEVTRKDNSFSQTMLIK